MLNLCTAVLLFCITVPSIFLLLKHKTKTQTSCSTKLPRSYPIVGSLLEIFKNRERFVQWMSDILISTSTLTFCLHRGFGFKVIATANPAVVQHILKSNFHNYSKGEYFRTNLRDLLGNGIFNSDGDDWKFQRQVSSHEFNCKSLRKFVETVVDTEIADRLIPILKNAASQKTVLDFQDLLERFAFDNICKISFGYDPGYLSASLPQEKFSVAFEKATRLSSERFATFIPNFWKIKKALNVGLEKELKIAVSQVRELATKIFRKKMKEVEENPSIDHPADDLLSRFLSSGHSDEGFLTDIVISFILAGRETTSAALTWFFWLLSNHQEVENEIVREIKYKSESTSTYNDTKEMVFTHASLCESMRLYPPVPVDTKAALSDDILPDGTVVKKGMKISYYPYAMGRVEKVWGKDWAEFRPERWLQRDVAGDKWIFVNKDAYTYPVFQAGPRICLGKDMAFIQMKRVVAGVLQWFRVVPMVARRAEPEYVLALTAKMKGGFPVRIVARPGELVHVRNL